MHGIAPPFFALLWCTSKIGYLRKGVKISLLAPLRRDLQISVSKHPGDKPQANVV